MAKRIRILESGERVLEATPRSPMMRPPKALTPDESAQVRGAKRQRAAHQKKNPERYKDATSLSATGHSVGQVYSEMGWKDSGVGPKHYDEQLPGMSDPHAAPRPQRWHEMTDEQRAHTTRGLAMHGTSLDQMTRDFGAQLDQGFMRAHRHGADEPHAQTFYSTGEPRQLLDRSAKDLGIPQSHHATMHAIVSPNTKFKTANGTYPEERAATAAVQWSQEGRSEPLNSANYKASAPERENIGLTARPANMQKAVHVMNQLRSGTPLSDTTGPSGIPVFGEQSPKTGPYANSWSDSHPQFFVSDVHSGGGGMLPHLGYDKPYLFKKNGEPSMAGAKQNRDKSEREKAISTVPHFHAAADEAARRAMVPRGLGSLREAQAVQWGEEQIQRGPRHGVAESTAYPPRRDRGHFEQGLLSLD